jgi:protein-S-isoprenylcysteine O-methyltransferase Ste14
MPSDTTSPAREPRWKLTARAFGRVPMLALLFLGAGRIDWARGWLFLGLLLGSIALNFLLMHWKNPSLVRARLEKHDNVEPFDRAFFAVSVPLGLLFLVVAGLDERFGWSGLADSWLWVGVALHVAGAIPVALASVHNPFLELAVRLQRDRGQFAVQAGPYRYVRHPMYAGLL